MKKIFLAIALLACSVFVSAQNKTDYVNMFMGVRGGSNCVIGPQLPHGSVNPSPQTPQGGHGAYKENQPIRGFAQLHVSGTGWGRYGQILLSPQRGFTSVEDGHDSDKSEEQATPYYYKVRLNRYDVLTEIAPAHHSVAYRFTYGKAAEGEANLLLDIAHNLSQHIVPEQHGEFLGGDIQFEPRTQMLTGYGEYRGGFGSEQPYKVFFAMWSNDFNLQNAQIGRSMTPDGQSLFAKILPAKDDGEPKVLYLGISLRSVDNAREYLKEECMGKGFDGLKNRAREAWEKALSAISIDAPDETKTLFYTALYHSQVMPRDRKDDNPRFMGENIDDHYCVWDTWRTCYPLLTLIDEPFVAKTVRSFINRYENDGKCTPTFTSSLEWDWRQGGDDVENVIADAMVRKVSGFDYFEAYEWLKWSAQNNRSKEYLQLGWQPEVDTLMSCSNALEYAYNDYCVYQAAKMMRDHKFAKEMKQRSASWTKLFNKTLADESGYQGFIAPRRENGEWLPLDPRKGYGSWVEYFYEGNSWTYSLFTPHDFKHLIKLSGGKKKMTERLRYGFDNELIALWNEPGFLSPFIFHYCDRPDLTSEYVGKLRQKNFSIEKGYCDNEDSGAMGSWYVFTSLGLFPNAGQDCYYLFAPAVDHAILKLSTGKTLTIRHKGEGDRVKEVKFRGKRLKKMMVKHTELRKGGVLEFVMEK